MQAKAMVSLLDMALGQFELIALYEVDILGFLVVVGYLLITFIMLFNLLIALMTDTYTQIREESEQVCTLNPEP